MRIITTKTLRDFWERHHDAEQSLRTWHKITERADWQSPAQVKEIFGNASIIANDRVVFNIKGNDYRLVVHIRYNYRRVYIRFIGTHAEYDAINAAEV